MHRPYTKDIDDATYRKVIEALRNMDASTILIASDLHLDIDQVCRVKTEIAIYPELIKEYT